MISGVGGCNTADHAPTTTLSHTPSPPPPLTHSLTPLPPPHSPLLLVSVVLGGYYGSGSLPSLTHPLSTPSPSLTPSTPPPPPLPPPTISGIGGLLRVRLPPPHTPSLPSHTHTPLSHAHSPPPLPSSTISGIGGLLRVRLASRGGRCDLLHARPSHR